MAEQTPSTSATSPLPPPPLAALGLVLGGACLVGFAAGWLMHGGDEGGLLGIGLAVGCVALAGVAALGVLRGLAVMKEANVATVVLGVTTARLLGLLALCVVAVAAFDPARKPFVNTLLVAAMVALILETMILRKWAGSVGDAPAAAAPVTK